MDKYTVFADKLGKVCDGSGKYMKVSIKELEKGMIIDSDIFSKKGALLLYKGFKIENPDLVAIVLHRNGIDEILVKFFLLPNHNSSSLTVTFKFSRIGKMAERPKARPC